MKTKVLTFGGTGNMSLYLTNRLKDSYDVTILNISGEIIEGVKTIKGDVNDTKLLASLKDKFDVVFDFLLFNKEQAKERIEIFKDVKQYVYISSVTVFNREKAVYITEESEKGNRYSEYARNKLEAEEEFIKSNMNYTIIRPSQTYSDVRIPLSVKGAKCYPVIQRMIDGKEVLIHGDGTNVWPCMHALDMANILEKLILNKKAIKNDFNVCSNELLTFNMIYTKIAKNLNAKFKPVYITSKELEKETEYDFKTVFMGDKRYSCVFSIKKLESVIDYELKVSIDEGIRRYIANDKNKLEKDEKFNAWCDDKILKR